MTSAYSDSSLVLILPKLKPACDVPKGEASGEWITYSKVAFQKVASSLDYKSPSELKSISSVPTMWARPLTMEMALHQANHPTKNAMVVQWRGMLAAIAFAAIHNSPLTAKRLQLEESQYQPFARSLSRLMPDATNALYDCEGKDEGNPWRDIVLFLWNNKAIGMTTPSTLIVPSEQGDWTGLRWWKNGMLQDPTPYLNDMEKSYLWQWLQNIQKELMPEQYGGSVTASNTMFRLIAEFKANLCATTPENNSKLVDDPEFFGIAINRGVLRALNFPIQAPDRDSNVQVVPSATKKPTQKLIIIDPEMAGRLGERPENIQIHKDKTLASLNLADLETWQKKWQVQLKRPEELFLPELRFIDIGDAIPGSLQPKTMPDIELAGEHLTPLLPINPLLLEYFTPEDLCDRVRFQLIGTDSVQVSIDLPLSGNGSPVNYRVSRTYELRKENAFDGVPILEVWPNLRSPNWHEYYVFYYDAGLGKDTFQIKVGGVELGDKNIHDFIHTFHEEDEEYRMFRLKEFPTVIHCQNAANQTIGIILLKQPPEVLPNKSWKVGVDFGTSFTNVYVRRDNNVVEKLPIENLLFKVTAGPLDTRFPVLFNYFIPEEFLPPGEPLPLSSVLTTRGGIQGDKRAIFDGRIYVPEQGKFDPQKEWIKTNLKWGTNLDTPNRTANQLFLKNLILYISALAAKQGVSKIEWLLSYPSAFSRNDRIAYAKVWGEDLTDSEFAPKTGIQHICSPDPDSYHYRTESVAVAQYFVDDANEGHNLVFSTCVDMGGGSSDISIWENRTLLHQCSVQLAGRDLISKFLELNPKFLERRFGVNPNDWRDLTDSAFQAKLDVLLRWQSEAWLRDQRPTFNNNEEDVQGLVRLMSLGFSGLYYYIGIVLRVLRQEGKYSRDRITPVYLGGNGSRLLHWIDPNGQFTAHSEVNDFLSRMLARGSGFEDSKEETRLSRNPKHEVARGLVLQRTELKVGDKKKQDPIITGEDCQLNGALLSWDQRLKIEDDVTSFQIPTLTYLSRFLYDFHVGLKDLDIGGIRPLKGYNRSIELSDNPELWDGTRRQLEEILQSPTLIGEKSNIRSEPPFILGLKALLNYLGREWAGR